MSRFENYEDEDRIPHARRARDGYGGGRRPATTLSALGILSVIGGILSLVVALIPCVGSLAMISGFIGLVLGGVSVAMARLHNHGKGTPIAGVVLNVLSIAVSVAMVYFIWSFVSAPNERAERVKNETAIPIEASRLAGEYAADAQKADSEYKDKVLEVTGRVLSTRAQYPDMVVTFARGGVELQFKCDGGCKDETFPRGAVMTLRGLCSGRRSNVDKDTVYFDHCIALHGPNHSPSATVELPPAAVIDATTLLSDYGHDGEKAGREKAGRNYKGRYLEITASVQRITKDQYGGYDLVLHAASKGIYCPFSSSVSERIEKLKLGDKVTIRGTCVGSGKYTVDLHCCSFVE